MDQTFTTILVVLGSIALWFLYLKVEPWSRDKRFFNVFFPSAFDIVVIMLALLILTGGDWWTNPIMARVNNQEFTAHVWAYMMIPIFYGFILWRTKDSWQSFLATGLMAATNEEIWFIYYYWNYRNTLTTTNILPSFNYLLALGSIFFLYRKKYSTTGLGKIVAVMLIGMQIWYGEGFPITVMNTPFRQTIWYNDLVVNLIEILHWVVAFTTFTIWLHLYSRKTPTIGLKGKRENEEDVSLTFPSDIC